MAIVCVLRWLILLVLTTSVFATTTPSTTTTTTAATTTSTPSHTADSLSSHDVLFCWCDLRLNQCDVNCCCDEDCTESDRLSFSACIDYQPVDTRACVQKSVMFRNNTPYTVDTSVSGLFCVHTNNYDLANHYKAPSLVTSVSEFDYYRSQSPSYTYAGRFESGHRITTNNSQYYVSGDPLLTVYKTADGRSQLGMLAFPAASAASMTCLNTNPAAYLYGQTSRCVQSLPRENLAAECTENVMLQATTYYDGFKLVTTPAAISASSSKITHTLLLALMSLITFFSL